MRIEYPEPQRQRAVWQSLNGEWDFRFGDEKNGAYSLKIQVPFAYQCEASGVGDTVNHDEVWYKRRFELSDEMKKSKSVILNFLACDFRCNVWINGVFAVSHEGGYGAFHVDITSLLKKRGEQEIVVKVYDPLTKVYPRGKQTWLDRRDRCWYYPTSGIWQSVWLDGTQGDYISQLEITPCVETTTALVCVETEHDLADEIVMTVVTPSGTVRTFTSTLKDDGRFKMVAAFEKPDPVHDGHLWSPWRPNLYKAKLSVRRSGKILDEIDTYFAFRKIHTENGKVYLNDIPLTMKLVLNQGYWEGYGMTPPSAECYKEDILIAKEMGFNGMRVHQKVEDPYLYYYADVLGFLVWAETPSAYDFRPEMQRTVVQTQTDLIKKVYNHPCVIAYVPLNESWGVKEIRFDEKQKAFARSLYWYIKSYDSSRLVVTNDGWENMGLSDLITVHDYSKYADEFPQKYAEFKEDLIPAGRRLMAENERISGQPILLSEFGGITLVNQNGGWGYGGAEASKEDFLARFERILKNVQASKFCGWCYTQLTDAEQETNGLLDGEHKPKFDVKLIRDLIKKYE